MNNFKKRLNVQEEEPQVHPGIVEQPVGQIETQEEIAVQTEKKRKKSQPIPEVKADETENN